MEGICPGPRGYTPAPYEKCHGILVLSYDSIFAFSANIFPNPSTALLLSKWQTTQAYANVLTRADSKFSFDSPLKPHNQATDQQNIQFLLAPRQNQSLKSVSYSKPPLPVTKCNQNHKYVIPRYLEPVNFYAPTDRPLNISTQHVSAQAQPEEDLGCFYYKTLIATLYK